VFVFSSLQCPTTIVPFFGDQFLWGWRVCAAGCGPEPLPITQFSLDRLVSCIHFMIHREAQNAARAMAARIGEEDGVQGAVDVFHRAPARGVQGAK